MFNLGADFNVTPKLRAFVNGNYLRFDRTEPLELLLFQRPIRHSIGTDLGMGVEYRPPLSENIVLTGGISSLVPGKRFRRDLQRQDSILSLRQNKVSVLKVIVWRERPRSCRQWQKVHQ